MKILRNHWYDLGAILLILVLGFISLNLKTMTDYQLLMWFSLASLFLHQLEEYRIVGTFPGMINTVMYKSIQPDRYPLNPNTAFYINIFVGWAVYFLAALFAENAIWLGIAAIMISLGNTIAHTLIFNIKGKTLYNAGLVTSWLFFVPCVYFFIVIVMRENLVSMLDLIIGIPLGIVLNVIGVLKMIDWMANKNTPYVFEQRNLLTKDRIK